MVLEWIRRKDPMFDKKLKDYLFTAKSIAHDWQRQLQIPADSNGLSNRRRQDCK